eukprot:267187-Rhodomonas_salina.1
MYLADAEHDKTISDNVEKMQVHDMTTLGRAWLCLLVFVLAVEGLALGVTGRMRMWAFDRGRSGFPSKSCRMRSRRCSLLSHSPMEEGRYSPASLCCLPYRPPASPRSPLYALPRRLIPHSRELKSLHPRNRALALQICACILNNSALVWLRRTSAPSSAWCRRKSR